MRYSRRCWKVSASYYLEIQYGPEAVGQIAFRYWLLYQSNPSIEPSMMNNCVPGISCHEQDFQIGTFFQCGNRQFLSIQARHNNVREQQIYLSTRIGDHVECCCRITHFDYMIIQRTEQIPNMLSNVIIIFDEENALAVALSRYGGGVNYLRRTERR